MDNGGTTWENICHIVPGVYASENANFLGNAPLSETLRSATIVWRTAIANLECFKQNCPEAAFGEVGIIGWTA
jgi:hypothetical protein